MLEGQVAFYLNKYLGKYCYGLDPQSLKISVFKGDVELTNLQLKPEALADLNLPITVKSGLLGKLTLKVPWASLGRAPVIVEMDRLYVLAGPRVETEGPESDENHDFAEAELAAKRKRIANAELTSVQNHLKLEKQAEGGPSGGRLKAIIDTVIGNLQLSITNIHIRYEDDASNPEMPFACGLTLEQLSAHTVDEAGKPAFVKDNPLEMLRKASHLRRFALYFDVGGELWKPKKEWSDMLAYDWDVLFKPGIAAADPGETPKYKEGKLPQPERAYILKPIDGKLTYVRRGKNVRRDESDAIQQADLYLQGISLQLSKPQYQSFQALLDEFSSYAARAPNRMLRPVGRVRPGKSAVHWWHYAVAAVTRSRQGRSFNWKQLETVCKLRREYIPLYIRCLQEDQMGGNDEIAAMDRDLPESTILLFRRLAHAKVERENKKKAAAAAAEKRAQQGSGWFGWLTGGGNKGGQEGDPGEDPELKGDLSEQDYAKLQELVDEQEAAIQAGKETPYNLRTKLNVNVGSAALVLTDPEGQQILRAALDDLKSAVKVFPSTLEVVAAVQAMGCVTPEGTLIRTGTDLRRVSMQRSVSARALEGTDMEGIAASGQALTVRYIQKPQDGSADTVIRAGLSPSYVTYNASTVQKVSAFFKTGQAVDLSALGAQALAQVERARKAAAEQLAAAIRQKPRLDLSLELDAPKIAIPVPATIDGRGKLMLVADFGRFVLKSDTALAATLPVEEASVYECLTLKGRDISAYVVDGDFTFAALEEQAAKQQAADPAEGSAVSEAIGQAVAETDGVALGGSAVFIPLLERCGTSAALQAARFPHPTLPPIRLQLQVPQLRFYFSPARIGRVMRAIGAVMPAEEGAQGQQEQPASLEAWRLRPEKTGTLRILTWGGIGYSTAQWQRYFASLYRGKLYLQEQEGAVSVARTVNAWSNRRIVKLPPDVVGGVANAVGLLPPQLDMDRVAEDRDAVLLRFQEADEAVEWAASLLRSQQTMQDLTEDRDPTSPLDMAEWDEGSSMTSGAEPGEDPQAAAAQTAAKQPAITLDLSAELGELAIIVSGRPTDVWWPPEGLDGPEAEGAATSAALRKAPDGSSGIVNVDGEQTLVAVRASAGSTTLVMGPGSMKVDVAVGNFEIADLLVGTVCPEHGYLARSTEAPAVVGGDEFFAPEADLQRGGSIDSSGRLSRTPSGADRFEDAEGPDEIPEVDRQTRLKHTEERKKLQQRRGHFQHAWTIQYAALKPESPQYTSVDGELNMQLTTLYFFCNRPTIGALMGIGTDLSAALARKPVDAPAASVGTETGVDEGGEEPGKQRDLQASELSKAPSAQPGAAGLMREGGTERTVFKMSIKLSKLEARMDYEAAEAAPLALLSMEAVHFDLAIHPSTMKLTASLGNLRGQDGQLPEGHSYRTWCDLRKGAATSLVSVEYATHTREEAEGNERVPSGYEFATLQAKLSELDFVFLNRFIQELLAYISVLLALRPLPLEDQWAHQQDNKITQSAAVAVAHDAQHPAGVKKAPTKEAAGSSTRSGDSRGKAGGGQQDQPDQQQEMGMILQLDIDMEAPVITMPRNSDSSDSLQVDLGSFTLHNRLEWVNGKGKEDPEAVLLEQDLLSLKDLSAVIVCDGRRGDNLIRQYDHGMAITLQRAVYDPQHNIPAVDVGIDVPSVKTSLSEEEYSLITSMAGENFSEAQRMPQAARWLQRYYRPQPEAEAASPEEGEGAEEEPEEGAGGHQEGEQQLTKQQQFQRVASTRSTRDQGSPLSPDARKSSLRLQITVGLAEVELLRSVEGDDAVSAPLARFQIGGLWLTYRTTYGGEMFLSLSLPKVEALDMRPWVPPEHALVISSAHINPDGYAEADDKAEWPPPADLPAHLMKPSFLTLEMQAQPRAAQQKLTLRLQRPTVVAEVSFMLAVTKFFVPGFAMSGVTPIPFNTSDLLLQGKVHRAEGDMWLSPESRLLADAPGSPEDVVYDGQGHRIILPQDLVASDPLPLILIGSGRTLQLRNVKVVYAASLAACLQLGAGAQLVAHPGDNVERIEGADPDESEDGRALGHLASTLKSGAGMSRTIRAVSGGVAGLRKSMSGMPRGGGRGRAVAPDLVEDARSAVTAAAAQTLQSKTLLLEVEAVGMGLRFVEIEAAQQEADLLKADLGGQAAAVSKERRRHEQHSVRMLAASLDLAARYRVEGDEQTAHAELRGFKVATQINLSEAHAQSEAEETAHQESSQVRGSVLEPCRIAVDMTLRNPGPVGDLNFSISDLRLNLSADILELVGSLQSSVLEPLVQPSPDQPVAKCTRFTQLWTNQPDHRTSAAACTDAHVLGSDRGITVWRPQAPIGYAILGDCITDGGSQPTFQVLAVAVNSGLVTYPTGYTKVWGSRGLALWQPKPHDQYVGLGCIATPGDEAPSLTAMVCLHQAACTEAALGQSLSPTAGRQQPSQKDSKLADSMLWCIDNSAATFLVGSTEHHGEPAGPMLDLRSPLGMTPAALAQPAAAAQGALSPRAIPAKAVGFDSYRSFRKTRHQLLRTQSKRRLQATAVDFRRIWWDKSVRGNSKEGAGIWRPVPPQGYVSLGGCLVESYEMTVTATKPCFAAGDCLVTGYDPPEGVTVIQDSDLTDGTGQRDGTPLLTQPRGFAFVWMDEHTREDQRLCIWKAVPMPGYVAMGFVATAGRKVPLPKVMRCVRADAVGRQPGYTGRANWLLPAHRNRAPLAAWLGDDRLGTFLAAVPTSPPQPEDMYRLRLLDEGGEGTGEQRQQAQKEQSLNVVVRTGHTSLLLRDALRRPLLEVELGEVESGLRRLSGNVLQAYLGFKTSAWSYNSVISAWEPVLEPWDLIVKLDMNPGSLAAHGVSPGTYLTVKSTSETLHLTLAYAAASSFVAALQEWQDLRAVQGKETYKRQLAAADASSLHTVVHNRLGVGAQLELDFGDRLVTADLDIDKATPVLQPMTRPPMRHSQQQAVQPQAQPPALLMVDVMAATGIEDLLGRGTAGVAPHELLCSLQWADSSSEDGAETSKIRTRAVRVGDSSEAVWAERLVAQLPGATGSSGTLRLQLLDTAAEAGRGVVLAEAEADLNMQAWESNATYGATLQLKAKKGQAGGSLSVRYTLALQHEEEHSMHTDAWTERVSTAGQRALRVDPDGRWVVLSQQGLQRGQSAGKKVSAGSRQQKATAATVTPVRLADGGVALESNFRQGVKHEVLRSLCQLVNTTKLALEICIMEQPEEDWQMLPRQARSLSSHQLQMQRQLSQRASGGQAVEEEVWEHQRFFPVRGWTSTLPTERKRFARSEDGSGSQHKFPQVDPPDGWEWEGPWQVETGPHMDREGWMYAPDFGAMDWPPLPGAEKQQLCDFTRRRRWLRRRRESLAGSAPPTPSSARPAPSAQLQGNSSRRTTSLRSMAAAAAQQRPGKRTVLGTVQPGESLSVPYGWRSAGKQLQVRPVLDSDNPDTHGWSVGASEGDHTIRLDAMDEGMTRLVACPPSAEATSKGKEAVSQDNKTLASKLAASPIWLSLTVDADTFPSSSQEYDPLTDWKIVAAAPLILENQLPVAGTYLVWEKPKDGVDLVLRQSAIVDSGRRAHIYSADTRRAVSLQFYPDRYDLVEDSPVLISEGYSSHRAGVSSGRQQLPDKFNVSTGGQLPQEIFLDREIDLDAWMLEGNEKQQQLDPGAAVAMGAPLLVRMFVPLWLVNATNLPVAAVVVATQPPPRPKEAAEGSAQGGLQQAADSAQLRIMDTAPRQQAEDLPPGARRVDGGQVSMMTYPMQRLAAFKQQGERQQHFGLCLKVGQSGWTRPLPLENGGVGSEVEDFNTQPVLIRAKIPEWGTVHEVVARTELVGRGFERTLALRIAHHTVVSNRTGIPLQLMHASTQDVSRQLGRQSAGTLPAARERQEGALRPPASAPGLRAALPDTGLDWQSSLELPAGATGIPLHWALHTDKRAVCLRFAPEDRSDLSAPWSHSVQIGQAGKGDQHVAIPVRVPGKDQQGNGKGGEGGYLRLISTLQTGTGPAFELHGPRVAKRIRHAHQLGDSQQKQQGGSPPEVEMVVLRFSLELRSPGCMHFVLESVSPKPPYLIENRTAHPFRYRQSLRQGELPYQALPPYSAAGFAWQHLDGRARRAVEVQESYGKQAPQRISLDPPDPKALTDDASQHGGSSQMMRIALSVEPRLAYVQVLDHQQEMVSAAGIQSLGGGGGSLGRGKVDRVLRITPGKARATSDVGPLGAPAVDDASGRALYVTVTLGLLDISLVDHKPEELLTASLAGLRLEFAAGIGPEGSFQRMRVSVQSVQIDDQMFASRFPVVLAPVEARDGGDVHPLVCLTVVSQPGQTRVHTYYPFISFRMARDLQISVSEPLVWRLVDMVQRLDLASLGSGSGPQQAQAATDVPVLISLVSIADLGGLVSFRGDLTARPRWAKEQRALSWALDMASFENIPVTLKGFEMEDASMLWSVFVAQIGRNVKNQLMGVALSFLRNFGVLSGASGVLGALSAGVASAALDDRFAVQRAQQRSERTVEGVGDGIVEGGAAFGMGIYRGFTGLVTKPVEGAKSKGVGGFVKGVGKGIIGAVAQPVSGGLDLMSSTFEGFGAVQDNLMGRQRSNARRLRLPRAIGGDCKLQPFLRDDGEKQARIEEVGQGLLRRTQEASGLGIRRKGQRSRFHLDAYEEHMLLPEEHVVVLTNRRIMQLKAPGFADIQRAAEMGQSPTSMADLPAAKVSWAVSWQDLLSLEVKWGYRDLPYPDRIWLHRKGKPGHAEEEPLAHELRCFPNTPQADQVKVIAQKVCAKYYSDPMKENARWARRHAAMQDPSQGLPKQEMPATLLSMDFKPAWWSDRSNPSAPSYWLPVAPQGYGALGHVVSLGFDPPAEPVQVYRNDSHKGDNAPIRPAAEFHLVWRQNGQSPVTMWEPIPPVGYCALGTVVVGGVEQPLPEDVLCVRKDLCQQSDLFNAPLWRYEPPALQASINVQRLKPYYPETWRCSCWPVDNPAGTFIAMRSLQKPPRDVALSPTGIK